MVFPLRHAWVDDRRIKLRDREVIVPGVASIVRKLFGSTGSPFEGMVTAGGLSASSSLANSPMVPSLMGGLGATSGTNHESIAPVSVRARVEADISTNTLLIFDEPKRRKEYTELLARIDVPKKMIETQLVVVDIERRALEQLRQRWRQQLENDLAQSPNHQSVQQSTEVLTPTQFRKFFLELRELERTRQANILSSPSLLSVNAQPAVLDITESMRDPSVNEAISTTTGARTNIVAGGMAGMIAGNNKSDGGSPTAKGSDRNTGTYLYLSARVLEGRYREREKIKEPDVVALNLEIADDQVDHSSHDFSPHHRRTLLNTQVMVQEGYSLLLGGHHIRVSEPRSQKIRERLLLLTPSIASFTQKILRDELAPPESFFNTPVRPPPGKYPSSGPSKIPRKM
jgi:type III secretion protein C